MTRFQGIFPAIITPMTSTGELHEEAFRSVIEFNINAGVDGFWTAGGTGESIFLDDEENRRIAEILVDQSKGRVNNIMHVGAATTARAAALAKHAASVGVEAICCVPPFFYGRPDHEIVTHFRIVAEEADLPLFVYNLPASTGVDISPDLMKKIQDAVPQLTGLKHSSPVFPNIRAFHKMGLSCLMGNHQLMLPAMTFGATGCVDGPPIVAPEYWVKIREAYYDGDLESAVAAQNEACRVWEMIGAAGGEFHATAKYALTLRLEIDCGDPRPPGLPLTSAQRSGIEKAMVELNLI